MREMRLLANGETTDPKTQAALQKQVVNGLLKNMDTANAGDLEGEAEASRHLEQ